MAIGSAAGSGAEWFSAAGAVTDCGGNQAVLVAANVIARLAHAAAKFRVDLAGADVGGAHGARVRDQTGLAVGVKLDLQGSAPVDGGAGRAEGEGAALLFLAPGRTARTQQTGASSALTGGRAAFVTFFAGERLWQGQEVTLLLAQGHRSRDEEELSLTDV